MVQHETMEEADAEQTNSEYKTLPLSLCKFCIRKSDSYFITKY